MNCKMKSWHNSYRLRKETRLLFANLLVKTSYLMLTYFKDFSLQNIQEQWKRLRNFSITNKQWSYIKLIKD
jgi:hypothetical protein